MTLQNPLGRAGTRQPVPVSSGTDSLPKVTEKSWPTRSVISPCETALLLAERPGCRSPRGPIGESDRHGFPNRVVPGAADGSAPARRAARLAYTLVLMGAPGTIAG